jgi:translocation protein SEC66
VTRYCVVVTRPSMLTVEQANALAQGWGQTIFQSANEIAANTMLRDKLEEIQEQTDSEKEWWEKRREAIRQDFEKELDEEEQKDTKKDTKIGSDDDGVLVDSSTPAVTPGSAKKKKAKK